MTLHLDMSDTKKSKYMAAVRWFYRKCEVQLKCKDALRNLHVCEVFYDAKKKYDVIELATVIGKCSVSCIVVDI